jgi:hypothetical protein
MAIFIVDAWLDWLRTEGVADIDRSVADEEP